MLVLVAAGFLAAFFVMTLVIVRRDRREAVRHQAELERIARISMGEPAARVARPRHPRHLHSIDAKRDARPTPKGGRWVV